MIIDCISDLHGYYPTLEGGDLLIVVGDLTAKDEPEEYIYFRDWLSKQNYKKKIVIAGNHDDNLQLDYIFGSTPFLEIADYLCDSGTEFEGLKIWGSPWSLWFAGINPKCTAFTGNEDDLAKAYEKIPSDIDILITHTPPFGILDKCRNGNVGSKTLLSTIDRIKPSLNVFGHIHENGGTVFDSTSTKFVNASIVNERYEHMNKPIRIVLEDHYWSKLAEEAEIKSKGQRRIPAEEVWKKCDLE